MIEVTVNDNPWYPQPGSGQAEFCPPHRVSLITYTYTPDGLPQLVFAYGKDENGNEITISENTNSYDEHHNLTREEQNHVGAPVTNPPESARRSTWVQVVPAARRLPAMSFFDPGEDSV